MSGGSKDCLCDSHSIVVAQLLLSQPQMFLLCPKHMPQYRGWTLALASSPARGKSSPTYSPLFPPTSFVLPSFAWFYVFFSGDLALLPILSWCCKLFCVWRCIPDVYIGRDVLHIYLFLLLLVPPPQYPLHFKPHTRSFYPVAAQKQGSLNWHISIKPHITKLRKMCVLLTGKKMHNLKVEKYVLFGELPEHIKPGR